MSADKTQLLKRLYFDYGKPYALSGWRALLTAARKIDSTFTQKEVRDFLHTTSTYTKFFPIRLRTRTNKWVATGLDSHHMADLAMFPRLKKFNNGYIYVLIVVDVLSRYIFAR